MQICQQIGFVGDASGADTYGPDQSQTELSYLYFTNHRGSFSSGVFARLVHRRLLKESHYGSEISIIRDRVVNHGGYDYGNVLYGDGHVESKVITGGMVTLYGYPSNHWLSYHFKSGELFFNGSGDDRTDGNYSSSNPYEGNDRGLGINGSINFFGAMFDHINIDISTPGGTSGNPDHQP